MKKTLALFCLLILIFSLGYAQGTPLAERLAKMKRFSGYFPFYWDAQTGKIWLEIDKLDYEFLYVTSLSAGVGSTAGGIAGNSFVH